MTKRLHLITLALVMFLFTIGFAEEKKEPAKGWQKAAKAQLNVTQVSFDNWAKGGENSWSWQFIFNGHLNWQGEKTQWNNSLKFSYGKTKVGDDQAKKNMDELRIESVLTYNMGLYVNPFLSITGLTQFTEGYDYSTQPATVISKFMDPGYFTQSAGFGIQPVKPVKIRLGAALKETFTKEFTHYADGQKTRLEYGMESVTDINWSVVKNVLYVAKLQLFSNLKAINQVDVDWDNTLSSKINDFLTVSFSVKLFYDRDLSAKRQLKQTFAVGIAYDFF